MGQLKVGQGAWVIVCDGRKALILENTGDDAYPDLRIVENQKREDPPTSAIGSDSPGTVHQSSETMRSSVGQTDWHDEAERLFLAALAARLDRAVTGRETRALVVVAPPRARGMKRTGYTAHVRAALVDEIDKDLVALPVKDIEANLFGKRK